MYPPPLAFRPHLQQQRSTTRSTRSTTDFVRPSFASTTRPAVSAAILHNRVRVRLDGEARGQRRRHAHEVCRAHHGGTADANRQENINADIDSSLCLRRLMRRSSPLPRHSSSDSNNCCCCSNPLLCCLGVHPIARSGHKLIPVTVYVDPTPVLESGGHDAVPVSIYRGVNGQKN